MTALTLCAVVVAVVSGVRGTWSPCGLSMLSAINPVSERARGHRFWLTCALFVAGALAGGLVLGLGAAVLALAAAPLPASVAVGVGAVAAAVTLASDLEVGGFALPHHPRQVDEDWLSAYRRWVYAAGFGAQIGTGFATYVMTAATYLLVGLAALTGSPAEALWLGAVFGTTRGLAVLISARATTPELLRDVHRRLAALDAPSLHLAVAVQAVVAVVLGGATAGPAGAAVAALVCCGLAIGRSGVRGRRLSLLTSAGRDPSS